MRFVIASLVLLIASPAAAEDTESPFDHQFAVGVYGTAHAGSYQAAGVGGRLRYEPFTLLGVEAYLEAVVVAWEGEGFRHDYPNGFSLYVPWRLTEGFRIRPYFGFCDVLSFVEPTQEHAPRADDILFGAHVGVGAELAWDAHFTAFADLQANFYGGHDRTSDQWTGGVDEALSFFWNVQLNVGVQAHAFER